MPSQAMHTVSQDDEGREELVLDIDLDDSPLRDKTESFVQSSLVDEEQE